MSKYNFRVECPFFLEHEDKMKKLSQSIHQSKLISRKLSKAQELTDILKNLSTCHRYDDKNEVFQSCNFILKLRSESARIVIEASEIAS